MERIWAEINLDHLKENYRRIASHAAGAKILGVVKADAYGHGAVQVARTLEALGCAYLGVAAVGEGVQLRAHGVRAPILVLGAAERESVPAACRNALTLTAANVEHARMLSQAAVGELCVHAKVDTGMTRLGVTARDHVEDAARALTAIAALPRLRLEGAFTHFAVADAPEGRAYTEEQFRLFTEVVRAAERMGLKVPIKHCANSAAVVQYPYMHLDMVRPGIILYGCEPARSMRGCMDLKPVLSLKARVAQVKDVAAGTCVSYGRHYITAGTRRIAVISAGYADGYMRRNSDRSDMLLANRRAPVRGRVCMDMTMADVTGIPGVSAGDTATLIGADVTAWELAENCETIAYEVLCALSKRVPRVYLENGAEIARTVYVP